MDRFCRQCGASLPETGGFCPACGTRRDDADEAGQTAAARMEAAPPASATALPQPAPGKRAGRPLGLIVGIVIAVVGATAVAVVAGPTLVGMLSAQPSAAPTPIPTAFAQPSHGPVTPAPRASSTPVPRTVGDGTEILVQSLASLDGARTITFTGVFGGTIAAQGVGPVDLSTITMTGSVDVAGQKLKVSLDAPTFLGTKLDAIYADGALYYRVLGPMAAMASLDPNGRYTRLDAPLPSLPQAADPGANLAAIRSAVSAFDNQPVQLANEPCGTVDCNHVLIRLSDRELAASRSSGSGMRLTSMTVELWSRTDTHRPEKLSVSVGAGAQASMSVTLTLSYDQPVSISAPPADEVAPRPSASSAY